MKPSPLKYYNCPNCGPIAVKNLTGDWCPSFECEGQPLPITRAQFIEMTEEEQFCPRDWVEDFQHENGKYECACVICHKRFMGHKRRCVCKVCDAESQLKQPTDPTAYPWPEARLAHEFGQPVEYMDSFGTGWFDCPHPLFTHDSLKYRQKLNPTMDEIKAAYKKNWRGVQYEFMATGWGCDVDLNFCGALSHYRLTPISELQKLKEEQEKQESPSRPLTTDVDIPALVEKCLTQLYGEPYIYNTSYRKCYLSPRKVVKDIIQEAIANSKTKPKPSEPKPVPLDDAYTAAWLAQEKQWQDLAEWCKKNGAPLTERTHLMDFAAGWSEAVKHIQSPAKEDKVKPVETNPKRFIRDWTIDEVPVGAVVKWDDCSMSIITAKDKTLATYGGG